MRFLKAALIGLAVVLVIALGAGAYLLSRIDEEALVREAQAAVKNATGRTLDIGGEIDYRIFFRPAIVVENVRFSNASWGSRPDMVRARRLEVELDLLPLFRGALRIERVVAVGPDVLLETDAKGRANWHFDVEPAAGKPADSAMQSFLAIETGSTRIRDGVLVYRNGLLGTETRVELKTLDLADSASGQPSAVEITGQVNRRKFEVKGMLGDPAVLLASGGVFPFDLTLTAAQARITAKGQVTDALGRADAKVQVELEAAEARELAAFVDKRVPPLGPIKARATIERDKGRLGLRDLDLALGRPGALQVSARGNIRDVLKPAGAQIEFTASAPRSKQAPAFRASGRLEDLKAGVHVSGLKIVSGANELKGVLEYHPGKARPRVVASLEGAALDLGFLAAARDSTSSGEPRSGGPLFTREPLPLGRLRALDVDARISLGSLVLPNRVTLRKFTAKVVLRGGKLQVEPVNFMAGGGRTTAALSLDASGDTGSLSAQLEGQRIVLGDLLAGTPLGGKIKGGPTDVNLKVTTRGSSQHEWAAGLNGNLRIVVGEARAKAREIDYGSDALTGMLNAINPFRETDPEVPVQCVAVKLAITKGVARSDRGVGAETDKMSILSSGMVDLGKEVLDLQIRPRAKEGIGLGGANLAQMVRLTGPLANPQLEMDVEGAVGATASIVAGVATGGLSLLGQKLLDTSANENACKIALGSASTQTKGSTAEPGRAEEPTAMQPVAKEPSAKEPPAKKEERGFLDKIFGK